MPSESSAHASGGSRATRWARAPPLAPIVGNLGLSHVRQGEIDGAVEILHSAIDVAEATRGGGGLNIVFDVGRELGPWRDLPAVRDVHDRLLALMTAA